MDISPYLTKCFTHCGKLASISLFNKWLQTDPVTWNRLASTRELVLEVHCSEPKVDTFVNLNAKGFGHLDANQIPDVCIKGDRSSFVSIFCREFTSLGDIPNLELYGEDSTLEFLEILYAGFDPDWETSLRMTLGTISGACVSAVLHKSIKSIWNAKKFFTHSVNPYKR